MSTTPPDPPARPGLLPANGEPFQPPQAPEPSGDEEVLPGWDVEPPPASAVPVAEPVGADEAPADAPVATPVPEEPPPLPAESIEPSPAPPTVEEPVAVEPAVVAPAIPALPSPLVEPTTIVCPSCTTVGPLDSKFCFDCGYYFTKDDLDAARAGAKVAPPAPVPPATSAVGVRMRNRYELQDLLSDRFGVQRFRGRDLEQDGKEVVVIRQAVPPPPLPIEELPQALPMAEGDEALTPVLDEVDLDEFVPSTVFPETVIMPGQPSWPSLAWERRLLGIIESPNLPAEVDYFTEDGYECLVLEVPTGQLLWDAWDDLDVGASVKFGYLSDLANLLHLLHQCGAMVEGLRPELVVVDEAGRVRLKDLSYLLPLPFPPDTPVRASLYTAPELTSGQGIADARADLYGFGAMLYSLSVGRELNERTDFDGPGNPKPYIPRFPDCHPAFGRLMTKTFRKGVDSRFPTDEAGKTDPTGFVELINTLEVLRRTYDQVRLEVASWTSTGIVRTGNEDAFAVMHSVESRQDDLGEAVLIILCDGMGGYEAGEVAAAMTISSIRKQLTKVRPFSVAAGESPFLTDPAGHGSKETGHAPSPVDVEEVKKAIRQALRDANKLVFQTSRAPGSKRRGMGCTAEVVYVDGRNVIVGHVGDSRTYHLHEGNLVQMTRDQTLVNRLVELGSLTEEEAETHPRRNELQQAIGGQPDVEPGLYHGRMVVGDWVVVCSDGLTNHVNSRDLSEMLRREAWSAETAARRLVNLTLIEGATDNVTVVAVRGT